MYLCKLPILTSYDTTQALHGCRKPVSQDVRNNSGNGRNPCF